MAWESSSSRIAPVLHTVGGPYNCAEHYVRTGHTPPGPRTAVLHESGAHSGASHAKRSQQVSRGRPCALCTQCTPSRLGLAPNDVLHDILARAWSSFKSIALCCLARFSCVGRVSATNIHRLAFKAKLGHSSTGGWVVDLKSCSEMAVIMRVLVHVLAPHKVTSPAKSSSSSKSTSGLHHDASDTRGL